MPPLCYYLDPELLRTVLFESTPTEVGYAPDKAMIFDYVGLTVAVRTNGWVFVYEPTDRNNRLLRLSSTVTTEPRLSTARQAGSGVTPRTLGRVRQRLNKRIQLSAGPR